jgi:H+/gluconate symporter-like permease
MENINQILNPAIVSVLVTSIVAPFIFYFLKRRDEIKKRNFEVRYTEYKKYLNTLENISS